MPFLAEPASGAGFFAAAAAAPDLPAVLLPAVAGLDLKILPCLLPPPLRSLAALPTLPLLLPGTRRDSCCFSPPPPLLLAASPAALAEAAPVASDLLLDALSARAKLAPMPGIRDPALAAPAAAAAGLLAAAVTACRRELTAARSAAPGTPPPEAGCLLGVEAPEAAADSAGDLGEAAPGILLVSDPLRT